MSNDVRLTKIKNLEQLSIEDRDAINGVINKIKKVVELSPLFTAIVAIEEMIKETDELINSLNKEEQGKEEEKIPAEFLTAVQCASLIGYKKATVFILEQLKKLENEEKIKITCDWDSDKGAVRNETH